MGGSLQANLGMEIGTNQTPDPDRFPPKRRPSVASANSRWYHCGRAFHTDEPDRGSSDCAGPNYMPKISPPHKMSISNVTRDATRFFPGKNAPWINTSQASFFSSCSLRRGRRNAGQCLVPGSQLHASRLAELSSHASR